MGETDYCFTLNVFIKFYCPMLLLNGKACIWNSEAKVYFDIFCFFLSLLHIILDLLQEILFYCAWTAAQAELLACWHATNISKGSSQRGLHRCLQVDTNIPDPLATDIGMLLPQICHSFVFMWASVSSCVFVCLFVCLEWDQHNKITLMFFTLLVTMAQCAVRNHEAVGSC